MRFICAVTIVGLATLSLAPSAYGDGQGKIYVEVALRLAGEQTGCCFTIERDQRENAKNKFSELCSKYVNKPVGLKTPDDVIEYLRPQLPNAIVVIDKKEPQIIHVIDASLQKDADYILSRDATLKFSGTPMELLEKLDSMFDHRVTKATGILANEPIGDYLSHISFNAEKLNIRTMLSAFLPLERYRKEYYKILWKADTVREGKADVTYVHCYGWHAQKEGSKKMPEGHH